MWSLLFIEIMFLVDGIYPLLYSMSHLQSAATEHPYIKKNRQVFFSCFNKLWKVQLPKMSVEMSGIEPEAFRMRNGRSTTELHPPVDNNAIMLKIYSKAKFLNYLILYNRQLNIIIQQKSLLGFLHYKNNYCKVYDSTANVLKFFHNTDDDVDVSPTELVTVIHPCFHWRLPLRRRRR